MKIIFKLNLGKYKGGRMLDYIDYNEDSGYLVLEFTERGCYEITINWLSWGSYGTTPLSFYKVEPYVARYSAFMDCKPDHIKITGINHYDSELSLL